MSFQVSDHGDGILNKRENATHELFAIYIYCFCQRETFYIFFTNLKNSKLISELVSSDKTVFLCINATQV